MTRSLARCQNLPEKKRRGIKSDNQISNFKMVDRTAAPRTNSSLKTNVKYSVLMPTYNERENLPLITYLLMKCATEK